MRGNPAFPSYEIARCPYGFYAAARDTPIFETPDGNFVVTKFEDVTRILRNHQLFSSYTVLMQNGEHRACTVDEARSGVSGPFVAIDPPTHTRRRNVARQILKPDDIASLEPLVESVVDALIDEFELSGACEFVSSFALRLPTRIVLTMLGLPLRTRGVPLAGRATTDAERGFIQKSAGRESKKRFWMWQITCAPRCSTATKIPGMMG